MKERHLKEGLVHRPFFHDRVAPSLNGDWICTSHTSGFFNLAPPPSGMRGFFNLLSKGPSLSKVLINVTWKRIKSDPMFLLQGNVFFFFFCLFSFAFLPFFFFLFHNITIRIISVVKFFFFFFFPDNPLSSGAFQRIIAHVQERANRSL